MSRTTAIIQASCDSCRLPNRDLVEIAGHPMLWHTINRVRRARRIRHITVSTTTNTSDDPIAAFCEEHGINCHRGRPDDALDRYWSGTCAAGADVIVRLNADCPLIDPLLIDSVIARFFSGAFDYVSNLDPPTFPDGQDIEVLSYDALHRAWREAEWRSEREHVTTYIRNNATDFRSSNICGDFDRSGLRLRVDSLEDLAVVRAIFHALEGADCYAVDGMWANDAEIFSLDAICNLLNHSPELRALNAHILRDEAYTRALATDALVQKRGNFDWHRVAA